MCLQDAAHVVSAVRGPCARVRYGAPNTAQNPVEFFRGGICLYATAFEGFVPALLGAGVDCELWAGTLAQQWMLLARRGALESPSEPLYLAVQGHAGESAALKH